jgi:transglutaminase/protease-like cytokinesis protein 3
VTYLLQSCQNETEKARVIYRWIANNISYDEATFQKHEAGITTGLPDQGAEAVFSRRTGVCEGYSNLFKQMCDYAGLQSVFIPGWGKIDYAYVAAGSYQSDHAWNAVQINGVWSLIDATWGAGYTDDTENFVKAFDDFWFLTPPEKFVYTHFPDDAKWQLLSTPYSASAIEQHPLVDATFFEYGLQIGGNDYPYYNIKNSLLLTIPAPPDVILSAEVFQNNAQITGNYTFCQRKDNANYEVSARFPVAGKYDLKIYVKWQNESGSYHQAVYYQIVTSQNLDNSSQFPKQYDLFGTKGAYLYTLVPGIVQSGVSYNYKISVPGAVEVVFITNSDSSSPVFHKLTKTGQIFEGTIDIVKGKMRISAKFPGDDSYWTLLEYTGQ